MSLRITTPPSELAVPLDVVKSHLGIEHDADDSSLVDLVNAAIELIQDECSIQLIDAVYTLRLDLFPHGREAIELERTPVSEVEEVSFTNEHGSSESIHSDGYQFDGSSYPARICPLPGDDWPRTRPGTLNAVTVRFRCGATSQDDVPASARKLIIYLCALWYEGRLPEGAAPAEDPFYRRQLDLLRWC